MFFSVHLHAVEKVSYQNKKIKTVSNLYIASDSLYNLYEFESAKIQNHQILESLKKKYSKNSQEVVFGIYKLALCEYRLGNYRNSDSLLSNAIVIQNQIDSTGLMSGRLRYIRSEVWDELCDCKETIPMAKKAVEILENNLGMNHPEVAYALEVLGYVIAHNYQYDTSLVILNRALTILENKYGKKSPKLSRVLCYLSRIYLIKYDTEKGLPFLERALSSITGDDKESSSRYAEVQFFKTFILYVRSDYEKAQTTSLLSIEAVLKSYDENHQKVSEYRAILSRIYQKLGKYELAEPLMLKVKNIYEKTFGKDNPVLYYSYINLGVLYISQGRLEEAEYYLNLCLENENIKESSRIGVLAYLAETYLELGAYKKAEAFSTEVVQFRTNQLDGNHPSVALSLKVLAKIYEKNKNFVKSQNIYLRILDIFQKNYGENSLYVASTLFDMASLYSSYEMYYKAEDFLLKTLAIRTNKLSPDHPLVANTYLELSIMQLQQNKIDESYNNMLKGLQNRRKFIHRVFRYASSEQKLLYSANHPLIYDPLLVFALKYKSSKITEAAAEMIFKGKALVIDALSNDKSISACEDDKEISLLVKRNADICTQISAIALSSKKNAIASIEKNNLSTLYKTRDSLEAELSKKCATFSVPDNLEYMTLEKIAAVLPENSLYIDYIKYHPILNNSSTTNYLAYTLNHEGEISFIDLGDAVVIDKLVFDAREKIQESRYQIYSSRVQHAENEFKAIAHELFCTLIKPFNKKLTGKQKLIIAPDSDLNLIPFEVFVDDNKNYLIESVEISYVSSGRDLLPNFIEFEEPHGLIVVASPDFSTRNNSQKFMKINKFQPSLGKNIYPVRSAESTSSCLENSFSPLTYSKEEGQSLVNVFKERYIDESAKLYYHTDATTANILNLASPPRYLHLSTHGFFCQSDKLLINPLLKSGLAFTGANISISGKMKTPYTYDDGILTALEVTGLNLMGTELVTLSACETGIGETVSGEGVFGLRRAFQIAGAKSILMSMWKIPDKETSELMIKFYKKYFSGKTKQVSLRESALEILQKSRNHHHHGHPYLWGGFILTGNSN